MKTLHEELTTTAYASASSSDNSVSTFGWDTAYIAPFTVVNKAIMDQKSFPATFNFTDPTGITIYGVWKSWQLSTGGAGQDMQMTCIVDSGTASGAGQSGDLSGSSIVIQVNLKQVAAQDPVNDPTAKAGTGNAQSLVVNTSAQGVDPAVSIIDATFPDVSSVLLQDLLNSIFKNYFNAAIGEFNHVFAVMNINEVADKDGFQWLKPTAFQYAVASPESATLDNSAFGLIAMVQNHAIQPSQQLAVDSRALSNLPTGANSAFVISENMVASNMLMNGAISTIQGSSASDFTLSTDGLSVTNVDDITWGNFQTDNGVISPVIAKNNFVLRADDTYVIVEIVDAHYETSPGVTVHMNMTQKFTFNTVQAKNGNYVFIPDTKGLGSPTISATVSLSEGLQITEVVMGAVAAIAGLLVIGSGIAGALAEGADVAVEEGENAANVAMDADGVAAAADANPAEAAEAEQAGAEDADEGANDPGNAAQVQNGGVFASTQFRLAVGVIGAIAGVTSGGIACAKAITNLDYDNIPAFNEFADNCLGASIWPSTTGYTLVAANFRSSLVMSLALN